MKKHEKSQGMVQYALILVLIIVVIMGVLITLWPTVSVWLAPILSWNWGLIILLTMVAITAIFIIVVCLRNLKQKHDDDKAFEAYRLRTGNVAIAHGPDTYANTAHAIGPKS